MQKNSSCTLLPIQDKKVYTFWKDFCLKVNVAVLQEFEQGFFYDISVHQVN